VLDSIQTEIADLRVQLATIPDPDARRSCETGAAMILVGIDELRDRIAARTTDT
jgi:hypothetical protein